MGEYLKTILTAVFCVGLISILYPKDTISKYIGILSGIIVMTVLVLPIINAGNEIDFDALDIEALELNTNSYLMEEFEKELAENIKKKLKDDTGINFSVVVCADKLDEIIEIKNIEIAPYSEEYAGIVSEYLGIDRGRVVQK